MKRNVSLPQISEQIAEILQVISPAARLAIVLTIGRGEACVCHLEAVLGWRQAYLSQHLMVLRKAEILQDRREGRYVYYRLADPALLDFVVAAARLSGLAPQTVTALLVNTTPITGCECPHCAPVMLKAV
jgi:ArsR family transcriptional regulator